MLSRIVYRVLRLVEDYEARDKSLPEQLRAVWAQPVPRKAKVLNLRVVRSQTRSVFSEAA